MTDFISRYLTDPPYTLSKQLTSRVHPPSSCALAITGLQPLR